MSVIQHVARSGRLGFKKRNTRYAKLVVNGKKKGIEVETVNSNNKVLL